MEHDVLLDETHHTRSVKRAADIIHALGSSSEGLKLTQLAREIDLSKATTHRILQTLVNEGLADYQEETATYVIGSALVRIALESRAASKLATIQSIERLSAPYMQQLCRATGETVALVMSHGNVRMNVAVNLGSYELIASPKVGAQLPLYAGGPGKVFLAFLPPVELDEFILRTKLAPMTRSTVASADALCKELRQIRKLGYAMSSGEAIEGRDSIAAPVLQRGKAVAVINLIIPTVRSNERRRKEFLPLVQKAAAEIGRLAEKA